MWELFRLCLMPNVAPQPGKPQIHLMSVQLEFVLLSLLVTCKSTSMHGLPCSSLGNCFGNPPDVNPDPAPPLEPNNSRQSWINRELPAADPVVSQPETLPGSPQEHQQPHRTVSRISTHSTTSRKVNGTSTNSIRHQQNQDDVPCFDSPPPCRSLSQSSEDDELELECSPEPERKYPQIPRPSIVILRSKVRRLWPVISDSN